MAMFALALARSAVAQTGAPGYYYLMSDTNQPPLPIDAFPDLTVYSLGTNQFLIDDVPGDYPAGDSFHSHFSADDVPDPPGSSEGTNSPVFSEMGFTHGSNDLNLWITGLTNTTAYLVIYPPLGVTNAVYDLQYCTNLTPPAAWRWVMRTDPGQTNLVVSNATDRQGFYRLAGPNDLLANDSLGTDFWLEFPPTDYLFHSNSLAIFISGSLATTGNVVLTSRLLKNG